MYHKEDDSGNSCASQGGLSPSSCGRLDIHSKEIEKWPSKTAKTLCYTMPSHCSIVSKKIYLPKPKLLQELEIFLERELIILKCPRKGPHALRLQAFSEVFDKLIVQFTTYQPLLSAIKNEYDLYMRFQNELIQELLPLKNKLHLIQNENEKRFQEFKRTTGLQNKKNIAKISEGFKKEIEKLESKKEKLKLQISRLYEEQLKTTQSLQNEADMKKLQVRELNELKDNVKELEEEVEQSAMIREKTFLETYRARISDLNNAQVQIKELSEKLEESKENRVPNSVHFELQDIHTALKVEYKQVKSQYGSLQKEHKILQESLKNLQQEKRELDDMYSRTTAQCKLSDTCSEVSQVIPKVKIHFTMESGTKDQGHRRATKHRKSIYKPLKWPIQHSSTKLSLNAKDQNKANKLPPVVKVDPVVAPPKTNTRKVAVQYTKSSSQPDLKETKEYHLINDQKKTRKSI